jgi:hypothetical protein
LKLAPAAPPITASIIQRPPLAKMSSWTSRSANTATIPSAHPPSRLAPYEPLPSADDRREGDRRGDGQISA